MCDIFPRRYTWVNGSDPVQKRKLKLWQHKMKPPPPPPPPSNATRGKTSGKASYKPVKDDLAQGDDDTISENRFREQDELRCGAAARVLQCKIVTLWIPQ